MQVRRYQQGDRAAVRTIAADSRRRAAGRSFFPDRELFIDLITRYYTDFEPGSAWVALVGIEERSARLTGCLHPSRRARVMALRIAPAAISRVMCSARVLCYVFRNLPTWTRSLFHRGPGWPKPVAHLHINVLDGHRGENAGGELMAAFLEQARTAGMKSIRVSTRDDNLKACRFFDKHGFVAVDKKPIFRSATVACARIYAKYL